MILLKTVGLFIKFFTINKSLIHFYKLTKNDNIINDFENIEQF